MIKNIYEPDNEDILFWLAHNEKRIKLNKLTVRLIMRYEYLG